MNVITGWVDIDRFQPVCDKEKEEIRDKLWLPSWKPIWVAISRLVPFKNIPAVLQVAKEVTERTDSYFLLVGWGPMMDEVRRMIQELGITQRAIFIWDIPTQDIAQYYQAWDYFLQMSTYVSTGVQSTKNEWETYIHTETMGRSAMEVMATWLPVIATAVWWVPEVLQDSGMLIPDNEVRVAVQAICEIMRNPLWAKQMGESWRNIAVNKFSWASAFNQYE
jgi:glycosyltransferase involved in cell wall biosynthesis